jgi:hypothetical protein
MLETVINLCYRLRTLFLFIVLFSTLHVSTSAGRQYNRTTKIDNSTEERGKVVDLRHEAKSSSRILDGVL